MSKSLYQSFYKYQTYASFFPTLKSEKVHAGERMDAWKTSLSSEVLHSLLIKSEKLLQSVRNPPLEPKLILFNCISTFLVQLFLSGLYVSIPQAISNKLSFLSSGLMFAVQGQIKAGVAGQISLQLNVYYICRHQICTCPDCTHCLFTNYVNCFACD